MILGYSWLKFNCLNKLANIIQHNIKIQILSE